MRHDDALLLTLIELLHSGRCLSKQQILKSKMYYFPDGVHIHNTSIREYK